MKLRRWGARHNSSVAELIDETADRVSIEYSLGRRSLELQLEQRGTGTDDSSWYYYELKFTQDELLDLLVHTLKGPIPESKRQELLVSIVSGND